MMTLLKIKRKNFKNKRPRENKEKRGNWESSDIQSYKKQAIKTKNQNRRNANVGAKNWNLYICCISHIKKVFWGFLV